MRSLMYCCVITVYVKHLTVRNEIVHTESITYCGRPKRLQFLHARSKKSMLCTHLLFIELNFDSDIKLLLYK